LLFLNHAGIAAVAVRAFKRRIETAPKTWATHADSAHEHGIAP
jgi:hypothetical protein